MQNLKIGLCSLDIKWHNCLLNIEKITKVIQQNSELDLIIFPEMCLSGFTMNPEQVALEMQYVESENFELQQLSNMSKIAIACSIAVKDENKFYNRFYLFTPYQKNQTYDKYHLFSLSNEPQIYEKGKKRQIFEYKGWKILPTICYDLRFPIFNRNNENYDLIINVANWPVQRIMHWDTLLKARAIENLSFVIGVNRYGNDENKLFYNSHSQAIDPYGNQLIFSETETFISTELNFQLINETRLKLPFLKDKDNFDLK